MGAFAPEYSTAHRRSDCFFMVCRGGKNQVVSLGKTRLRNLVRNKASGRYYARLYLRGKELWKSLKTFHFSVAEARLAALQKEHRKTRGKEVDTSNAKMTVDEAMQLQMQRI